MRFKSVAAVVDMISSLTGLVCRRAEPVVEVLTMQRLKKANGLESSDYITKPQLALITCLTALNRLML